MLEIYTAGESRRFSGVRCLSDALNFLAVTTRCRETCYVLMVFELRPAAYGGKPSNDVAKGTGLSGCVMNAWQTSMYQGPELLILTRRNALRHVRICAGDGRSLPSLPRPLMTRLSEVCTQNAIEFGPWISSVLVGSLTGRGMPKRRLIRHRVLPSSTRSAYDALTTNHPDFIPAFQRRR